jgi:hypothetical protein
MVAAPMAVGAATSVAGGGTATVESDTRRMAKAAAKKIEKVMAAQQWDTPTQPAHRS